MKFTVSMLRTDTFIFHRFVILHWGIIKEFVKESQKKKFEEYSTAGVHQHVCLCACGDSWRGLLSKGEGA